MAARGREHTSPSSSSSETILTATTRLLSWCSALKTFPKDPSPSCSSNVRNGLGDLAGSGIPAKYDSRGRAPPAHLASTSPGNWRRPAEDQKSSALAFAAHEPSRAPGPAAQLSAAPNPSSPSHPSAAQPRLPAASAPSGTPEAHPSQRAAPPAIVSKWIHGKSDQSKCGHRKRRHSERSRGESSRAKCGAIVRLAMVSVAVAREWPR